jgi:TldD protein
VQGQRRVSEVADFAQANPIVLLQPAAKLVKGSRNWKEELKTYSALCRAGMAVEKCEVSVRLTATTKYLVNSEGTRLRQGKTLAAFTAIVEALSEDGFRVNNFVTAYGRSPDELPPPEALQAKMENMLKELEAVRQVEELAHYSGPVLVTAAAAGPLLAGLLEGELDGGSPPQGLPEMALQRELQGRMNSRVLPEFLDVVDDPTQPEFNGQALLGLYEVDDEGVPAERVQLVERGVLKSWLMSRRPGKDLAASNGHGRASLFGQAGAAPANLFVQSRAGIPARELEERFLELCREQGREFCLVVERLNDPSFIPRDVSDMRGMMAMAQMMMGGGGQGVPVLTVYKIYPEDGRREQVRSGMITGLRIRNLRDIVAAGDDYGVHNFLRVSMGGGGLFDRILGMFGAGQAGGGVGLPTAVVAPSLLFEELELRKGSEEPEKVRLVPRPKIGG